MSNEDLGGIVRKHKFGPIVELSDGRKWQLEFDINKNIDEWIEDGDYPEIYFRDGNDDSEYETWKKHYERFEGERRERSRVLWQEWLADFTDLTESDKDRTRKIIEKDKPIES